MIVKIQISIVPRNKSMMLFTKSGEILYHGDITPKALELANDRFEYFADISIENDKPIINKEVPDPGW